MQIVVRTAISLTLTVTFWGIQSDAQAVVIDEESREPLTAPEQQLFGQSVGSVECTDPAGEAWASTGFVVARNVIVTAAHSFYDITQNNETGVSVRRTLIPTQHCVFNLRESTGNVTSTHKIIWVEECATYERLVELGNCDFAVAMLSGDVPSLVPSLELLNAGAKELEGFEVACVGFHQSAKGEDRAPEIRLIDYGSIPEKSIESRLKGLSDLFGHTCDTNPSSSGQPIFALQNDKAFVIGIHAGQYDYRDSYGRNRHYDDSDFFNYAGTIHPEIFDVIKLMAPAESARIDAAKARRLQR